MTLPPNPPEARFWSFTLYDNQTRSMLATPQRFPRAGSQSYPCPAAVANDDGSITVHFAPEQPAGVADGNWIQTMPGKGFFPVLRLYSPLQPFFDKSGASAKSNRHLEHHCSIPVQPDLRGVAPVEHTVMVAPSSSAGTEASRSG